MKSVVLLLVSLIVCIHAEELKFIKRFFGEKYVEVGGNVDLKCSINIKSKLSIQRFEEQKSIVEQQSNETVWQLRNAQLKDKGQYSCFVFYENDTIAINSSLQLIVFKFGNLSLSTVNKSHDKIFIRLNDASFKGTNVVLKMKNRKERIVLTKDSEPIIEYKDLDAYTSYEFSAYETAGNINGSITTLTQTTEETAPTPPNSVKFDNISGHAIDVIWEKPDKINGQLTEYLVKYSFKKGAHIETKNITKNLNSGDFARHLSITGLYAYVKYNVSVQEKTVAYSAPAVDMVTTTSGAPSKPDNLRQTQFETMVIKVEWDAIPNYLRGGELTGYQITIDKNEDNRQHVPPNTTSFIVADLQPYTNYTIKVAGVTNDNHGEEASVNASTKQAPPSQPRDLKCKQSYEYENGREVYQLELGWSTPLKLNGVISDFQIRYILVETCTRNSCRRRRRYGREQIIVSNVNKSSNLLSFRRFKVSESNKLKPFSRYEFQVKEKTEGGWGKYSEKITIQTLSARPSRPLNVTMAEITADSVSIMWVKPEEPNGIISSYTVLLKSNDGKKLYRQFVLAIIDGNDDLIMDIDSLDSETTYQIIVNAYTDEDKLMGGDSEILFISTTAKLTGFPWHLVLIGCLATVLLLALVIAIFLLVNRRRARYEEVRQNNDNIDLTAINKSKMVLVNDLNDYCIQHHANSDHGFQQEFESVRIPVHTFTWEHSQMPYNQSKNRYSNIVAYDHSRVILNMIDNDVGSTYINANYINGYQHTKKYIATQGPLPETVLDFWRMIWEQNSQVIVMLTKLVEDNKMKCEQYWPEGKALQYKDIVVTVNSVSEMTDYVVRVFTLHKINNPELGKREVRQFHYTAWPDHGVPSHPTSMLSFVRHVMSSMNNKRQDGAVVVHCSAGVGRTGTFIAIESSLRQIEHDQNLDVYGVVCRMRMQRNYMVQIEAQYTFIYDALLDSVICGNTEVPPADLLSKIRYLNQVDHKSGKTHFYEEFKRLETGLTSSDSIFVDASHMENKQKNRYLNILPYGHNRVKLVPIAGCRQSDYVNASMVDGFQHRNAFIATQAPLENTVTDFWRMIQERNIHIIVMLTKLVEKDQEKCYLYWPQAGTVSYGNIYVELVNVEQEEEHIVMHELRLTNRETGKSWTVNHFMYFGWPDSGSPKSGTELINLIGCVQRKQKSIANGGPTLVHCSGGVGRTGVFIAVFNSIEKLKAKNVVDIFQTIRQLRLQRVAMVQTLDQYIFCYQALKDYLDSFDLYTNVEC